MNSNSSAKSTAKSRRKDSAAKVTARSQASLGNAQRRRLDADAAPDPIGPGESTPDDAEVRSAAALYTHRCRSPPPPGCS